MTQPMDNLVQKCAVQGCTNHKHEWLFVGLLCSPCHRFISTGEGVYSQAYRNMREYAERAVEAARAEERDACSRVRAAKPKKLKAVGTGALLGEQQYCFEKGFKEGASSVRTAIRARGNT